MNINNGYNHLDTTINLRTSLSNNNLLIPIKKEEIFNCTSSLRFLDKINIIKNVERQSLELENVKKKLETVLNFNHVLYDSKIKNLQPMLFSSSSSSLINTMNNFRKDSSPQLNKMNKTQFLQKSIVKNTKKLLNETNCNWNNEMNSPPEELPEILPKLTKVVLNKRNNNNKLESSVDYKIIKQLKSNNPYKYNKFPESYDKLERCNIIEEEGQESIKTKGFNIEDYYIHSKENIKSTSKEKTSENKYENNIKRNGNLKKVFLRNIIKTLNLKLEIQNANQLISSSTTMKKRVNFINPIIKSSLNNTKNNSFFLYNHSNKWK